MDHSKIKNQTLSEIVSENYVFASILYYFGIRFFEYSDKTLDEVCKRNNIDPARVIQELNSSGSSKKKDPSLTQYPVDLLIEYLKHSHHIYAKRKLPYLANLIKDLQAQDDDYKQIIEDLKLVFPLFVEDFIHHIYLEEDTFFNYVKQLHKADIGKVAVGKVFFLMEKYSVVDFAAEHEADDDTMEGIRAITQNFKTDEDTPLHLKVVYEELMAFEKDLLNHAGIENNILFPKALTIENKLKRLFEQSSRLN